MSRKLRALSAAEKKNNEFAGRTISSLEAMGGAISDPVPPHVCDIA